jgi:hypothetical protein
MAWRDSIAELLTRDSAVRPAVLLALTLPANLKPKSEKR